MESIGIKQPAQSGKVPKALLVFLLLLAGALGIGLGSWGPLESSEARYAEIGREMLASGDWLHPRLLGIYHFHKPPLTYWLTAVGLGLTGSSVAGVRLLPVLAVLAQVVLVYGIGRLIFENNPSRALGAAIVYGTFPVVWISALNVTTDSYLATWELVAAYGVLHHYHRGGWGGFYVFWVALGLAFLTKGPVGLLLPLMAVASFYFRGQRARRPFTWHHAAGLALVIGVGLSWYGYLVAENPAFLRYFLVGHTVERFASAGAFGRAKPWWFYLVLVPATSLPWSGLLLTQAVRTGWKALPLPWRSIWLWWVLVPVIFFSLSQSKLLLYVLPVFTGMALLTSYYLHQLPATGLARWSTGLLVFWAVVLAALAALPVAAGLTYLMVPLPTSGVAALGVAGLVYLAGYSRQAPKKRLLGGATVFMVALLLAAKPLLQANELTFNGTQPVVAALEQAGLQNRPLLVYDELLPSLAFAMGRVPVSLYAGNHNLVRETQFETDSRWRATWLDLSGPPPAALDSLLRQRPLLLVKGEVHPEHQWLLQRLPQRQDVGKWRVYYER
ncbi:glycosyltransferase family 39 protein [Hymenobacter glacialis]|uniref:Glycosyltransferase RgtA/B/C/D-like domain-containing protein n=1 Tax=Hymenobacter glacialis TaxID=1908236 RepID=A0A1G1TCW0_9BACT|nr:glycosyltransferase family 39 protein [Hymenobacter glacialis]OGX88698.1 hypothetical protein BEN48_08770 [Hymenobacter glacialis]